MRLARPRRALLIALAAAFAAALTVPIDAQSRRSPRNRVDQIAPGPQDYRSRNFLVHTDLPPEEAQDLLKRLETMLSLISRYWGQPNRKTIECYVVKDLGNWPQQLFPPLGLSKIQEGAGVTISSIQVSGLTGKPVNATAVVYAVADDGVPQHEAVHAYCYQNFGDTGPTWYSEGMAEMGSYWREKDPSVELHEGVLQYLQQSEPKPLLAIVDNTDQSGDSWQNYAWRWALCHMLANNPNYAPRFRPLGLNLLLDKGDSFERTYGPMGEEIEFEYHFFLKHLENGLRADLIAWDWKAAFKQVQGKQAQGSRALAATVAANRGWQPSRLRVETDKEYRIVAIGAWQLEGQAAELSADGDDEGRGKLVGIVLDPVTRTLGEPFDLGADTTFTAPSEGHLYVRCNDGWGDLADNSGKISIKLTLADD